MTTLHVRTQAAEPCATCKKRQAREPQGYVAWHEWAEKKSKTHDQEQCPLCGLWRKSVV